MYPKQEGVVVYSLETGKAKVEYFANECKILLHVNQQKYAWLQIGQWLAKHNGTNH